jgi:hypothetical protein
VRLEVVLDENAQMVVIGPGEHEPNGHGSKPFAKARVDVRNNHRHSAA